MKKIMICAMILLPLIILLILSVSGVIVSTSTYLYVEDVAFVDEEVVLTKTSENPVTAQLLVNILPKFAKNQNLTFWSDDDSIVSVNETGVVTGLTFGETYVYVKSVENESKVDACKVTVTDTKIHTIKLDNPISLMYVNDTYRLLTSITPEEVNNPKLIYESSDTNILDVSPDGELTSFNNTGSAVITIYSEANPLAKLSFTVLVRTRIDGMTIEDSSQVCISNNAYQFPNITIYPSNAEVKIAYSSSDSSIATVDDKGYITFKKAGIVTITASEPSGTSVSKKISYTAGYYESFVFEESNLDVAFELNKELDLKYLASPIGADQSNLFLSSSNENVIKIINGKFVIVGGGIATISAIYKTSMNSSRTTKCTVNVTKNVEGIGVYNNSNEETQYIVSRQRIIELNAKTIPEDAITSSIITYSLDDTSNASISNGVLNIIDDIYTSVNVKFSIDGFEKTVNYVYIPTSLNPFLINKGNNEKKLYMPKSTFEQKLLSTPYIHGANIQSISYSVDSKNVEVTNEVLLIKEQGNFTLTIYANGQEYSKVAYSIVREVEQIVDIKVKGINNSTEELISISDDLVYSAYKEYELVYTLSPLNTTTTNASINIVGSSATYESNKIVFNKAGSVKVEFTIDKLYYSFTLESTFGLFDKYTKVKDAITINAGDVLNPKDLFSVYSPLNAFVESMSVTSSNDNVASVNLNKEVKGVHGGDVNVVVSFTTAKATTSHDIHIHVNEQVETVDVINSFVYLNDNSINLLDYYSLLPSTSNIQTEVSYEIVEGGAFSTINNSTLSFTEAGLSKVKIKTKNDIENTISFIYIGKTKVLDAESGVMDYEINKPFILRVQDSALSNAMSTNSFYVEGDISIKNGAILTITSVTTDKKANAFVEFASNNYSLRGIIKAENIELTVKNITDAHTISEDNYLTGLSEIILQASVLPSTATNDEVSYLVSDDTIAEMNVNTLVFKKAGEVTVTAYNKDGNQKSIKISSTYGKLLRVSSLIDDLSYDFDNDISSNNVKDLSSLFKSYPSQVALTNSNVTLVVSNDIASISNYSLTLLKGGDGVISVKINGEDEVVLSLNLSINRAATSILLDNNDISTYTSTQSVNSSIKSFKTAYYPQDATTNKQITYQIISGSTYASIIGKSLVFNEINQEVGVEFTLGSGENEKNWTVTYKSTSLTQSVDIDGTIIIAPAGEKFSLNSTKGDTFSYVSSTISFNIDSVPNYLYNDATSGTITLTINGSNVTKDIVLTKRVNEIENVQLDGSAIEYDGLYQTADKSIPLSFASINYALNKNNTIPSVNVVSSDETIAKYVGNNIVFYKNGEVNIEIVVNGEDFYGVYSEVYSFNVYSSCGRADEFTFVNPYPTGLVLDNVNSINLISYLTPTFPVLGTIEPTYLYSSSDTSIATINSSGVVSILSTGEVTISVKSISGRNVDVIKSITLNIDKYIDLINFIDNGVKVNQDATNDSTYQIVIEKKSSTSVLPTLNQVTYEVVSGDANVSSLGLVSFTADNTKCVIRVYANSGDAESQLVLYKLDSSVTILDVNSAIDSVSIGINENAFINTQFIDGVVTYDISSFASLTQVDSVVNSFKGTVGSENIISLSGVTKNIKLIVTQDVEDILFKVGAPTDLYLIAEDALDIVSTYGAYVNPSTAMDEDGIIEIEYLVNNITGEATISGGVLTFTKQGIVEVVFKAGYIQKTRKVESTLYYAKDVEFPPSIQTEFNFVDGEYTIPVSKFIVTPSKATKQNIFFTSSNEEVFKIEDGKIVFTGGGYANLELNYYIRENVYQTKTIQIFINNRVSAVNVKDGEDIVGYIVKDNDFTLDTEVVFSGSKISAYTLEYESLDTSIAEVNASGYIHFIQKEKVVVIKVKVINDFDSNVDAEVEIYVICTDLNIQKVYGNESLTIEYSSLVKTILYPIPENGDNEFTYSVTSGSDVLSISNGIITLNKGGYSTIKISSSVDLTINVFSLRNVENITFTNANITDSLFITSKENVSLGTTLMPADAKYEKTIEYIYDTSIATIDSNGNITFKQAGILNVTIKAKYQGNVESVKNISIQSTMNEVLSFSVKQNGAALKSNYEISNVGQSIVFTIENVIPADYSGQIHATTTSTDLFQITVSSKTITVKGLAKGQGNVDFEISGVKYQTNINVLQKTSSIDISYDGQSISEIKTLDSSFKVLYQAYPLDANNRECTYSISGGATIDQNGNISFSGCSYGTYTVTCTAKDGCAVKTLQVTYAEDISGVEVKYKGNALKQNDVIHLNYNEQEVIVSLTATPKTIGVNYSLFTISSTNGSTASVTNNIMTIKTLPTSSNPAFEDTITIKYKSIISFVIKISRFGVESVNFGDHTAAMDALCGLQQVRVTGYKSYYDGATVNYYKMPLNVTPSSLYNKIVWSASNSKVKITSYDGYAQVDLSSAPQCSRDEIANDNFSKGSVTVYAKDNQGNILAQYTFVVVNAVNIFDQAGFTSAEKYLVLQKNFVHDYEIEQGLANSTRLDAYAAKKTIYGNGNIINYAYQNSTSDGDSHPGCSNNYVFNTILRGTNISTSESDRMTKLSNVRVMKYCEVTHFYRGIEAYDATKDNGGCKVSKCMFRSITLESLYINKSGNPIQELYIEDMLAFDVGATVIDVEGKDVFLKGFLDIYNYQNKNKFIAIFGTSTAASILKPIADGVLESISNDNPNYAAKHNKLYYANVVIVGTSEDTSPDNIYYWDKTSGTYVYQQDGIGSLKDLKLMDVSSATGMSLIKSIISGYCLKVWCLPDTVGNPRWTDQYNSDGSLNVSILANREKNLCRSYRVNNPL